MNSFIQILPSKDVKKLCVHSIAHIASSVGKLAFNDRVDPLVTLEVGIRGVFLILNLFTLEVATLFWR